MPLRATYKKLSVRKLFWDIVSIRICPILHQQNCCINKISCLNYITDNFLKVFKVLYWWCTSSDVWFLFWSAVMTRCAVRQDINIWLQIYLNVYLCFNVPKYSLIFTNTVWYSQIQFSILEKVMTRYVTRQVINMLLPLLKWSNVTSSGFLSVLDPAFDKGKTSNLIQTKLYLSFISKSGIAGLQIFARFRLKSGLDRSVLNFEWRRGWQTDGGEKGL